MNEERAVKVLFVEDDVGHVRLVTRNLARSGMKNEVIHFDSGEKVLNYLDDAANDDGRYLMILDLNMPGMNGYQVLQQLKQRGRAASMPIIVLTTAAGEREVQRCYELGCNAFITKPMGYEGFSKAVMQLGLFIESVRVPAHRDESGDQEFFVYY